MSKGFKNAPSATAFKRGMRVSREDNDYHIVYVTHDGDAVCDCGSILRPDYVPDCVLDLDPIWEGRDYYGDHESDSCRVEMANDDLVAYQTVNGTRTVVARPDFLQYWKPLPLDPPAEAEPAPAWVPEVGKECIYRDSAGVEWKAVARAIYSKFAWITRSPDSRGFITNLCYLGPLPPEPPVKVGEYVIATDRSGLEHVGRVSAIDCSKREFQLFYVGAWFGWDNVTITHLRPVEAP